MFGIRYNLQNFKFERRSEECEAKQCWDGLWCAFVTVCVPGCVVGPYKRGGGGLLPIRCDQAAEQEQDEGEDGVEELQRDDDGGHGHLGG